jgi:DNA-binding transcriptional LysR family regulator
LSALVVFREVVTATEAAEPDPPQLHQSAPADVWRVVRLGVRKRRRELKVRVDGQFVLNGTTQMLNAALAGFGLAYVPEDFAQPNLAQGRLKRVLDDWVPAFG